MLNLHPAAVSDASFVLGSEFPNKCTSGLRQHATDEQIIEKNIHKL